MSDYKWYMLISVCFELVVKREKCQKIGCKTCFWSCELKKNDVSLQPLTKQHNLFYTLKN